MSRGDSRVAHIKMESSETRQLLECGVTLYNAGEFFACHEVLEALWRADSSAYRNFYQGLIKAAVAWYHAQRGNFVGARKVLQGSLRQLHPYLNREMPLALDPFINASERCLHEIERCQGAGAAFDMQLVPALRWNRSFCRDSERSS